MKRKDHKNATLTIKFESSHDSGHRIPVKAYFGDWTNCNLGFPYMSEIYLLSKPILIGNTTNSVYKMILNDEDYNKILKNCRGIPTSEPFLIKCDLIWLRDEYNYIDYSDNNDWGDFEMDWQNID